jgi:hypothetical protein
MKDQNNLMSVVDVFNVNEVSNNEVSKKNKRQERFVQKSRFKKRAKNLLVNRHWINSNDTVAINRAVGMTYHSRALCSCPMCGNSRRHFGEKTIQERSFEEAFKKINN